MTWPEILQAYLDDLEKVNVGDLCHLNNAPSSSLPPPGTTDKGLYHPQPQPTHRLLDPKIRELKCHIDGRTFTPEPELPVPKVPSLQPWIHSQVRKRAVEKVSLDRVFESGNLVGLTKSQIRDYGRHHIRLRPGVVELLRAFVQEQDRREKAFTEGLGMEPQGEEKLRGQRRGELWIVSVNWSEDLIRGAMDQIFGSEEATERYLPDSNLTSSNLEFKEEGHEMLARRMKTANCNVRSKDKESDAGTAEHLSNGEVKVRCLTGTDKLHAFQKIQRDYATKHGLALTDTKWAYLGDSSTDLGCLVEADVGIIIGKSKSLLTECERSGIQVIDLVLKDTQ
ncbi:hypothetical protein BGX34_010986 [Mortierella sp. NVP85]|nr:hypothetical protein BGX34_010986 [Mortierella sp. NVP85]